MFGFPHDTIETMDETLNLALELKTEHANFYAAMALPGSPLYLHAKRNQWELPERFEEYAFLSYECKPLRTNTMSGAEVLRFRDEAWQKYFNYGPYLDLVENKFGLQSKNNLMEMAKIRLKRKQLGD
jgi:coproporphyrinogen III oxidase-like Fe-S oxidoreductase